MEKKIQTLEEVLVYSETDNPWLKLYFDRVQFGDGRRGRYNRIVEGMGDPAIAVLPISSNGIGLVRQFRYAVNEFVWEIPRGYGDSGDSEKEARRELLEETGLVPDEMIALNEIYPNSAVLTTRIVLFAARCNANNKTEPTDKTEQCEFRWFSLQEIMHRVENGGIKDAVTLSALLGAKIRDLL